MLNKEKIEKEFKNIVHINPDCLGAEFCEPHNETEKVYYSTESVLKYLQSQKEEWVKEIRSSFIREFCNDHNPQQGIRWLRGVAIDMEDLLEMILNFFDEQQLK
jgi:hypothetical protein